MRIVFMGSGGFATPTIEALLASEHEVVKVFTQPDRHAGRGRHTRPTPVKNAATALGIPVYQPASLKTGEALDELRKAECELVVVVAYGHLLPGAMLTIPERGCINAHASLLPKYRGAAPVPHAILNGEPETGITVFRLNEKFDQGDVLARKAEPITAEDTTGSILARLAPMAAQLVLEVIGEMSAGWLQPIPQIDAQATRAPKLSKAMGEIDWRLTRVQIDRRVRAFQPWPTAYTFFPTRKGRRHVGILHTSEPELHTPLSGPPGTILSTGQHTGLIVACKDGPLRLDMIKPEGKRAMSGLDFIHGHSIKPGTMIG